MFSTEHDVVRPAIPRAAVASGVAVIAVILLGQAGQDLTVAVDGPVQSVPTDAVGLAALAAGLIAPALAWLAMRSSRPRRAFLALVGAGLLLSSVPPLQAATTVTSAGWLLALHALVAAILVPPLARALPDHRLVTQAPEGSR